MGTTRREGRGQRSGLRGCEGRAVVLQRFKLKRKKGKKKKKKKTQLGLVEQVSSRAATRRTTWLACSQRDTVMASRPCFVCWKGGICVAKKMGKGVAGKGAEQVVKVVKGFKLEQVPRWGRVAHLHMPQIKPPPKFGMNTFLSKSILLCVVPMCLITQEIK